MNQKIKNQFAPLRKHLFVVSCFLYVMLLLFKKGNLLNNTLIQQHLADVLCLPILLSISLVIMRLVSQNENLQLSKIKIFVAFLYVSLLFEVLLPYFFTAYIADIWDVVAYGTGGIIFFINNRTH